MTTEYEPVDMAELEMEYARVSAEPGQAQNGQEDYFAKFVRLPIKDGFVQLRILPRQKGRKVYAGTRVHTLVNPSQRDENGRVKTRTFHCPKTLIQTEKGPRWQGECIICKYYSDLWQQSEKKPKGSQAEEDLQTRARAIKPVERYYYNVIVRSEKDKDGVMQSNVGPKIYSCGKTVHAKIVRAMVGDKTAGEKPLGDVSHPVNGRDFRLVKKVIKGAGGQEYPNYDNSKFEDPAPLGTPEQLTTWLETLHDLESLRIVKTDEELRKALRVHCGLDVELAKAEDHSLDEFREPAPTASVPTSTVSNTVREDLLVSTPVADSAPESSGEELLADDDFMDELNSM